MIISFLKLDCHYYRHKLCFIYLVETYIIYSELNKNLEILLTGVLDFTNLQKAVDVNIGEYT